MKVGDRVMRKPITLFAADENKPGVYTARDMVGTVDYINHAHGWYRVVFDTPGGKIAECFKGE